MCQSTLFGRVDRISVEIRAYILLHVLSPATCIQFEVAACLAGLEKDNLKGGSEKETCSKDLL